MMSERQLESVTIRLTHHVIEFDGNQYVFFFFFLMYCNAKVTQMKALSSLLDATAENTRRDYESCLSWNTLKMFQSISHREKTLESRRLEYERDRDEKAVKPSP